MGMLELSAMEQTPAPQLEAVRWQAKSGREVSHGNMEGGRR